MLSSSVDPGALLHARGVFATDAPAVPWRDIGVVVALSGGAYGALMGTFGGVGLQVPVSALKIPLLIAVSTLICLPSLFIVNTVVGLREDFGAVLRGIFAAQATVAVCLCALGPFLLLLYASTPDYQVTKAFNGALFLIASLAGQKTLAVHYAPLIRANKRHRTGRQVWWFLYVLVTIQMAWVLRPFIGAPGLPVQLFREEAWGNAYVQIYELIRDLLAGG
ncbi:MAG: hypothetical protein ACYTGW_10050 [Planctomycetota bacterium]